MKNSIFAIAISLFVISMSASVRAGGFEIGVGANYWYSMKDAVNEDFDRDGLGWMISSRIMLSDFFGFGIELEKSPDNFVKLDEPMYSPSAYLILGNGIYAACGIGAYYYDGEFYNDPWYALRLGFKIPVIPNALALDINANYRVDNWDDLGNVKNDISSDNVILGAAVRLLF